MSAYLLINLLIIAVPLAMSFEKSISFYKKLLPLLVSIISVGIIFIFWDIKATANGDWWFNEDYLLGIKIFNLPLEEWMFFVTVPYAVIFIYESIRKYVKEADYIFMRHVIIFVVSISVVLGFASLGKNYTATVLFIFSASMALILLSRSDILFKKTVLITILISFIPFLIVNSILTWLPIVSYNENSITGVRAGSIPVEDFLYSFIMISLWLFVYDIACRYFIKRGQIN